MRNIFDTIAFENGRDGRAQTIAVTIRRIMLDDAMMRDHVTTIPE